MTFFSEQEEKNRLKKLLIKFFKKFFKFFIIGLGFFYYPLSIYTETINLIKFV